MRSLQQLHERGGALEISVPRAEAVRAAGGDASTVEHGGDLIWRCRVLDLTSDEIALEHPTVLGRPVELHPGVQLAGIIGIGQNRWMFRTRVLGLTLVRRGRSEIPAVRIDMPDEVERCQRRSFYRVSTIGLRLPRVECRPLLDPRSVVSAETANEAEIRDLEAGAIAGRIGVGAEEVMLPEVGPPFFATLMNIGGGGAGLMIDGLERASLDAGPYFWLQLNLMPQIPAPLGVTARLVHTHMDSSQRTYAGMAFDFRFNPEHERFISERLCKYVAGLQRDAMRDTKKQDRASEGD